MPPDNGWLPAGVAPAGSAETENAWDDADNGPAHADRQDDNAASPQTPWRRPGNGVDYEAVRRAELAELRPPAPETDLPCGNIANLVLPDPRPRIEVERADFAALMPDVAERLLGRPKRNGGTEWRYGTHGSLAVDVEKGVWSDHEAGTGGGCLDLIVRELGGNHADAVDWLRAEGMLDNEQPKASAASEKSRIAAIYDYADERGKLLFQVCRMQPKDFRQRAADGSWTVKGIRRVPYRLPELLARPDGAKVFVVEGEKDANRLAELGLIATCNAGGASKWPGVLTPYFEGADVVILPDNDSPGRAHAEKVAVALTGTAASVRTVELPGLPHKGDVSDWIDAGGTAAELVAMAEGAADASCGPFEPEGLEAFLAGAIPPREWLLGRVLCRQYLSVLAAAGGAGKTSLAVALALSMATDRPLIGLRTHRRCRVLMLSFEDCRQEFRRRFRAACIRLKVDPADVGDRIMIQSLNGLGVTLATPQRDGTMEETAAPRQIAELIRKYKIDAVILDPWIKICGAPENSNDAVDQVTRILSRIAEQENVAVLVAHHLRKGVNDPGDVAGARGASALIDAARVALTLTQMSEAEAGHFGIPLAERRRYIRLDGGKQNLAPATETDWFHLDGVEIGNGTVNYPNGDNVQAIVRWSPPDAWAGLTCSLLNKILDDLDAGLDDGEKFSDAPNAQDRSAWPIVQRHAPGKSKEQCRNVVKAWVKSGTLKVVEYKSPSRRRMAKGFEVDPKKRPGAVS